MPLTKTSLKVGHKGRYEKQCIHCNVSFIATYPSVRMCAACRIRIEYWRDVCQVMYTRLSREKHLEKRREKCSPHIKTVPSKISFYE